MVNNKTIKELKEKMGLNFEEVYKQFLSPSLLHSIEIQKSIIQRFNDSQKPIIEKLLVAQAPLIEAQKTLQEKFVKQAEYVTKFIKAIDFAPLVSQSLSYSQIASSILESMKFRDEDEFKKFEYNWLGFLTLPEIKDFYKKWQAGKENDVRDFFFEMFNSEEKIDVLIEKFNKNEFFSQRIPIIKSALRAHLRGEYELSIPVLWTQFDGIFIKAKKDAVKDKYITICDECGAKKAISPNAKTIAKELAKEKGFLKEFLEFVIDEYNKKRSKILHGLEINYMNKDDSVKLILALYELYNNLTVYKNS